MLFIPEVILSLTTWKARIFSKQVHKNIFEHITKQKTKYKYKVVLVLSEEEFPKKEKEIPEWINELNTLCDNFELLWTYKNTKALKKLHPVIEKYPEIPIITIDDDICLKPNAIETYMNLHKKYPKHILSEKGSYLSEYKPPIYLTGYFRLYPPHALVKADENDFIKYYNCLEDDAYNGILAYLNNTPVKINLNKEICDLEWNNEFVKSALWNKYIHEDRKHMHENFYNSLHNRNY